MERRGFLGSLCALALAPADLLRGALRAGATTAEPAGRPAPLVFGRALNMPAAAVGPERLVYQVSGNPANITAVYVDGQPVPFVQNLPEDGYFSMAAPPKGAIVTADAETVPHPYIVRYKKETTFGTVPSGVGRVHLRHGIIESLDGRILARSLDGHTWTTR